MKITMLKGLPASGKTTWAMKQLSNGKNIRISRDDIRKNLFGSFSKKREGNVIKVRNQLIEAAISYGYNVIVDDTNLNPKHERDIRQLAEDLGVDFEVNDSFLDVDIEECIKRDLEREFSVGPAVIYGLANKWIIQPLEKRLSNDQDKRRCIIFNLNSVFEDAGDIDWIDYSRSITYVPNVFISAIADGLFETFESYLDVLIISDEDDKHRENIEEWLEKNSISYSNLFTRKSGDTRESTIVKKEIYMKEIAPKWCTLGVFEDNLEAATMWRNIGLKVAQTGNPYVI